MLHRSRVGSAGMHRQDSSSNKRAYQTFDRSAVWLGEAEVEGPARQAAFYVEDASAE
jgi:hypothetical protein